MPRKTPTSDDGPPPRPTIGVTMGDPAGIGAEVIVKALADESLRHRGRFVIYGLHELISYAADRAEISPYWFRVPHERMRRIESGVVVADFDEYAMIGPHVHKPTAEGGHASMRFCEDAIADLKRGLLSAVVTGPISKTSWRMAGYDFPGHTELFAKRLRARRVTMMFVADRLRVALASAHVPLFELRNRFTIGLVHQPIDLLNDALRRWFGIERPRIAVAALNPHAGEGGQFGDEEMRVIEPAIAMARDGGCLVEGPFPADTLFRRAAAGEFDGVVAMYHDQGLIPVKLLAFDRAVNVTLGLPAIRTSVDHGTAFDIAGRNQADAGSMKAALSLALDLAERAPLQGDDGATDALTAPEPTGRILMDD
jgi:4-hydroxythreonine-4-phosphate dehydrogenase